MRVQCAPTDPHFGLLFPFFSLNATHDGVQNACSLADRYVMAMGSGNVTDSNRRQPWFFSTCSVTEIDNFVKSSLADA